MSPPFKWTLIVALVAALLGAGGATARLALNQWGYRALLSVDADAIPASLKLDGFARSRGATLYRDACADCHGATLAGNTSLGAPALADTEWLYGEGRVSDIEQTLTHGIRSGDPKARNLASMPAYATPNPYARYKIPPLSPGDIRDVVEYLFTVEARPSDPVAARRGATLYAGRGGCYDCHGADARGDPAIGAPNLRDSIRLYGDGSREALFDSIARGRSGACPAWIGRRTAGEIRALAVFVHDRAVTHGGARS